MVVAAHSQRPVVAALDAGKAIPLLMVLGNCILYDEYYIRMGSGHKFCHSANPGWLVTIITTHPHVFCKSRFGDFEKTHV
jgi:hypothetical protein